MFRVVKLWIKILKIIQAYADITFGRNVLSNKICID